MSFGKLFETHNAIPKRRDSAPVPLPRNVPTKRGNVAVVTETGGVDVLNPNNVGKLLDPHTGRYNVIKQATGKQLFQSYPAVLDRSNTATPYSKVSTNPANVTNKTIAKQSYLSESTRNETVEMSGPYMSIISNHTIARGPPKKSYQRHVPNAATLVVPEEGSQQPHFIDTASVAPAPFKLNATVAKPVRVHQREGTKFVPLPEMFSNYTSNEAPLKRVNRVKAEQQAAYTKRQESVKQETLKDKQTSLDKKNSGGYGIPTAFQFVSENL